MFRAAASPQAAAALCPCTEPPLDQTGDALSISLALLRDGIPRDAAVPAPSTAAREPPGEGSVMGEIAQKAPRERERGPRSSAGNLCSGDRRVKASWRKSSASAG